MNSSILKIGNGQSFWGDSPKAPLRLVSEAPDLDVLTLDYLSEVSMSIMGAQRQKDPKKGYAEDFIGVIKNLIPFWKEGRPLKIVANAGGLNPKGCAEACKTVLNQAGLNLPIGIVYGDDVLETLRQKPHEASFNDLENQTPLAKVLKDLQTANAYLGAQPIAEALKRGAVIVITGRIADPSLVVGPCVAHYDWSWTDYDRLASATIAGHLIECGRQVTGGISNDWSDLEDYTNIGYPIIEMHSSGEFVVAKPSGTGGKVSANIVKEQILYEIGDPENYLSPDVTVSFLELKLAEIGVNKVSVKGAKGKAPTNYYKVSATYEDGYKAEAFLTLFGEQLIEKAKRCGEIIYRQVKQDGYELERFNVECLGSNAVVPQVFPSVEPLECVLRITASDHRKEAMEYFAKEIAPLVCGGPPGVTGYTSGRPKIRPVFGYWPCLISKADCHPQVEVMQ